MPFTIFRSPATRRLAVIYAAMAAPIGLQLPFLSIWYVTVGLGPEAIAIVQGATPIARFLSNFLIPPIADRRSCTRLLLIYCASGAAIAFSLLRFESEFWFIFFTIVTAAFLQGPQSVLIDSLILDERRIGIATGAASFDFGVIRGWASIAALATMLASGFIVGLSSSANIPLIIACGIALSVPIFWFCAPVAHESPCNLEKPATDSPVKNRALILVTILAASITQASHAIMYAFGSIGFRQLGCDETTIGVLWAISVAAEISFFMYFSSRFGGASMAYPFMIGGAVIAVLRWCLMAMISSPWALPFAQCLHLGSFAAPYLGSVYALERLVGEKRRAQSQGWLGGSMALTLAATTYATGHFWSQWGLHAYFAMAALAVLGLILSLHAYGMDRKS